MSPDAYRSNQSPVWGTLALIVLVAIAILLVGYFAWWVPARRETTIGGTPRKERETAPAPVPKEQPAPVPQPPPGK